MSDERGDEKKRIDGPGRSLERKRETGRAIGSEEIKTRTWRLRLYYRSVVFDTKHEEKDRRKERDKEKQEIKILRTMILARFVDGGSLRNCEKLASDMDLGKHDDNQRIVS